MQLLYALSDEGQTPMLNIIEGRVERFNDATVKVPHMGWNTVVPSPDGMRTLFRGIQQGEFFYFVHSYRVRSSNARIALTEYNGPFVSAVHRDNYWGVQFHPEKTSAAGLQLLKNFIEL